MNREEARISHWGDRGNYCCSGNEYHNCFWQEGEHYEISDFCVYNSCGTYRIGKIISLYEFYSTHYVQFIIYKTRNEFAASFPPHISSDPRWAKWFNSKEIENYELYAISPREYEVVTV